MTVDWIVHCLGSLRSKMTLSDSLSFPFHQELFFRASMNYVRIVLFELFCSNCFVWIVLFERFCSNCFVRIVLFELFCSNCFVRMVLFELFSSNWFFSNKFTPKTENIPIIIPNALTIIIFVPSIHFNILMYTKFDYLFTQVKYGQKISICSSNILVIIYLLCFWFPNNIYFYRETCLSHIYLFCYPVPTM
jgi:hypothetical protein